MSSSSDDTEKEAGYDTHATPTLSQTPIDAVPVYTIPNESGYFPTAFLNHELVSTGTPVHLYQIHPKYARQQHTSSEEITFPMIAEGTLTLSDPAPGTPSTIALIGRCENTIFNVRTSDATVKVSSNAYNLLLPQDCIRVQLPDDTADDVLLRIEGLLASRTKFSDRSALSVGKARDLVPKGRVSQSVYKMSVLLAGGIVSVSESGSRRIATYGETKRGSITETEEVAVSGAALGAASTVKKVAKVTNRVVGKIGSVLSKSIGGALATTISVSDKDGRTKRRGKRYLTASAIAFSEVADAVGEGYDRLSSATKDEATAFVAAKYGDDAGDFCRQTVGAAVNFGEAALAVRRVLDVKTVIKESAKVAAAKTMKNSISKGE